MCPEEIRLLRWVNDHAPTGSLALVARCSVDAPSVVTPLAPAATLPCNTVMVAFLLVLVSGASSPVAFPRHASIIATTRCSFPCLCMTLAIVTILFGIVAATSPGDISKRVTFAFGTISIVLPTRLALPSVTPINAGPNILFVVTPSPIAVFIRRARSCGDLSTKVFAFRTVPVDFHVRKALPMRSPTDAFSELLFLVTFVMFAIVTPRAVAAFVALHAM